MPNWSRPTPGRTLSPPLATIIYMPSSGDLALPGVRLEMTFYKGLLDKLGLKFDMLHMGKFKGAAEPMTRNTMSGPLRESLQAIVDDVYDDMVETIAKDRHLPDYTVKTLIDQGLFTAAEAKDAGLIDEVRLCRRVREVAWRAAQSGQGRRGNGLQEEANGTISPAWAAS